MGLQLMEEHPVAYECKCSRAKVESALISLGREELQRLIDEEDSTDVTCQFCDVIYHFDRKDLEELKRAQNTLKYILDEMGESDIPIKREWPAR